MKKKENSVFAKIDKHLSWALIFMGLVMLWSSFSKASSDLLITFAALAFLLAGFLIHLLIKENRTGNDLEIKNSFSSQDDIWAGFFAEKTEELPADLNIKLQLSYLFQIIDPLSPIKFQIEQICKTLAEIMPDKIFLIFELEHKRFKFIAGARLSGFSTGLRIQTEDPLVEQISSKFLSLIKPENLKQNAIWTDEVKFHDEKSDKEGLIIPGHHFGKTNIVLVCIESSANEFTDSQTFLLRHAARGMSVLFDNHILISKDQNNSSKMQETVIGKAILKKNLPDQLPAIDGWGLAKVSRSIQEEGKDFSLFANISSDQTLIITGSSSGKGLDAALFFVKLKTIIGCLAEICKSPAEILNRLSIQLSNDTENELFASLIAMQIKRHDRTVLIAVAGQNVPFLYRQKSGFVEIPALDCGVPVGLFNQGVEPYQNQAIHLLPGDGILLYTDGIFDLTDAGGQAIKSEELKIMLENISEVSAEKILMTLSQQLQTADNNGQAEEECTLLYAKTE